MFIASLNCLYSGFTNLPFSRHTKNEYFHLDVRRVKLENKTYTCKNCGIQVKSYDELQKHQKDMHTQYVCDKCEYESIGQKDLFYHNKYMHEAKE